MLPGGVPCPLLAWQWGRMVSPTEVPDSRWSNVDICPASNTSLINTNTFGYPKEVLKVGPQSSCISVTWKLVRNAIFGPHPRRSESETLGIGPQQSVF